MPGLAVSLLLAGTLACGGRPGPVRSLIDSRHRPVALVESEVLAPSGAAAANRFGAGWSVRQAHGESFLVPAAPVARLEVVNLGAGVARTLNLQGFALEPPDGRRVRLRTTERELARTALRLPLALRLPEDLPLGRVDLELSLEGGAGAWGLGVTSATIAPSLPPGRARVEGADVVAAGNVMVEVTHEIAGGEVLAGSFMPPTRARPGQRFELAAERPDGTPIRRFFWSPSFWDRFRGARTIELPLRDARDYIRVRLLSRGSSGDPPGRWRGLRLVPASGRELSPGL
jgi:hypothetical protein